MNFQNEISTIVNDHSHGSSFLLKQLIQIFLEYQPNKEATEAALSALKKIDASMVILHHFINYLENLPQNQSFHQFIQNYQNQWENANQSIARKLTKVLPKGAYKVLTHSHSGVVISVLTYLQESGYEFNIYQTESNPGGEGKIQAEALKNRGFVVNQIPDDQIKTTIQTIDIIILGVDHYTSTHFVNKVGSKQIVELAFEIGKTVFVLGDSRKQVEKVFEPGDMFEAAPLSNHTLLIHE